MIFDLQLFSLGETGIQINSVDKSIVEVNSSGGMGAGANWSSGNSVWIGLAMNTQGLVSGLTIATAAITSSTKVISFMNVSTSKNAVGSSWAAGGPALITNISITGDPLFANSTPYTLDLNNGAVSSVSVGAHALNLKLSKVASTGVTVYGLGSYTGGRTVEFAGASAQTLLSTATTTIGSVNMKNGKYNAELLQGSYLNGVSVVGTKNGSLTFNVGDASGKNVAGYSNLYFGRNSDSVFVNMNKIGGGDKLYLRAESEAGDLITVNNLKETLDIEGLSGAASVVINGDSSIKGKVIVENKDYKGTGIDTLSSVSIVGAESSTFAGVSTWSDSKAASFGITADLSGKGVEYISLGNHGVGVTASDWVFSNRSIVGSKGANVVSIGDHGILDVEGGIYKSVTYDTSKTDNKSGLTYDAGTGQAIVGVHMGGSGDSDKTGENGATSALLIQSAAINDGEKSNAIGAYEGIMIESKGKTYNGLLTSNASLKASDKGLSFGSYDIIIGEALNLGDRTDKKVVYLNNDLDKTSWADDVAYSANMTSVTSSSAGGSLIIGDYENSVYFYGNGDQDSLYGGYAYGHTSGVHYNNAGYTANGTYVSVDTLASAAGKKAWMGTSDNSGQTKVELVHNGSETYNFGFVGQAYTVNGTKGTEDEKTADVLALMHGMGVHSLQGSEHNRVNLIVGADAENNFTFQSITEGVHDIMYTWDLGANNFVARVDTSLRGSDSGFNYGDDVDFYLGFDKGTELTLDAKDTGKMVNYGGKNVIMGISTIDGSASTAGGNILNGETNHAEYIIGSAKAADTLCGGIDSKDKDTAADTLEGGAGADVFWVGAEMGNDVINNITDGDTIVFLNSKFADATLNYENERMQDLADSHWMTVNFSEEAGGASIRLTPGNGLTDHMHEVKNVTAVFDDGTYTWDGSTWTKA